MMLITLGRKEVLYLSEINFSPDTTEGVFIVPQRAEPSTLHWNILITKYFQFRKYFQALKYFLINNVLSH